MYLWLWLQLRWATEFVLDSFEKRDTCHGLVSQHRGLTRGQVVMVGLQYAGWRLGSLEGWLKIKGMGQSWKLKNSWSTVADQSQLERNEHGCWSHAWWYQSLKNGQKNINWVMSFSRPIVALRAMGHLNSFLYIVLGLTWIVRNNFDFAVGSVLDHSTSRLKVFTSTRWNTGPMWHLQDSESHVLQILDRVPCYI